MAAIFREIRLRMEDHNGQGKTRKSQMIDDDLLVWSRSILAPSAVDGRHQLKVAGTKLKGRQSIQDKIRSTDDRRNQS